MSVIRQFALFALLILCAAGMIVFLNVRTVTDAREKFVSREDATTRYYSSLICEDVRPLASLSALDPADARRLNLVIARMDELDKISATDDKLTSLPDVQRSLWTFITQASSPVLLTDQHFTDLKKRYARPGEAYNKVQAFNDAVVVLNAALDGPVGRQVNSWLHIAHQKYLRLNGAVETEQVIQL